MTAASSSPGTTTTTRAVKSSVVLRVAEVGQVLVPGIYAWAVTVVPAATERGPSGWAPVTAFMAFVSLVVGASLARSRPRLALGLGIWGFVLGCLGTWLIALPALSVERLDPWRAGAGAIGWLLYALGWGTPWQLGRHPEDDPRAQLHPKLEPRKPPRTRTAIVIVFGAFGAVGCLLFAWRASEPNHALMLHGAALACAVGIINAAASIGLAQGKRRMLPVAKQRLTFVFPWLMTIIALAIIALAWTIGT